MPGFLNIYRQMREKFSSGYSVFCGALQKLAYSTLLLALPFAVSAVTNTAEQAMARISLRPGATAEEIQRDLDLLTQGGQVVLPPGTIVVHQPIVLQYDHQTLCGASGQKTVLVLAKGANCPVIIMGEPVNHPTRTVRHLCIRDLFIDGNRLHQERELWREQGEGSEIRNNGITVQNVTDSLIDDVTCARCRSGGLVTTLGVRRLTVENFASYDNEFDGLACYLTMDSVFKKLQLHNNPGAGISLDLSFDHNTIANANLTGNDLGIFMRDSRGNQFKDLFIHNNRDYGVFMAQAMESTEHGVRPEPQTQCSGNSFTNLVDISNGRAAFRVNDASCTNNVIIGGTFGDRKGILALSTPMPGLVTLK